MTKVSTDTNAQSEQQAYMKDRVRALESDLERAIRDKTDAACEVRRLTQANEQLEKAMGELRLNQM